jgi:hypothetical protein
MEEARDVALGFRTPAAPAPLTKPDERLAREALRSQIAKLERQLADAFVSAFPRVMLDIAVPATGGPRLLSLGELETVRDSLVERVREARGVLAARGEAEARNRELLERVMLDPGRYRYVRISTADLGEGGCGEWHVRPRLGLIGMLAGWWQVKLSSGCPLARGPRGARAVPSRSRS